MVLIPKAVSGILCTQWKKWEVCLSVSWYLSFHILTFHLTFSWHFVFGVLLKFVVVLQFLVKIWQQLQTIYPKVSYSCAHLVQHPKNKWEQKMLGTKLVEKNETHFICSMLFLQVLQFLIYLHAVSSSNSRTFDLSASSVLLCFYKRVSNISIQQMRICMQ